MTAAAGRRILAPTVCWVRGAACRDGRNARGKVGPAWSGPGRPERLSRTPRRGCSCFIEPDRERSPATVRDYRSALNAGLPPDLGGRPPESVTVEAIQARQALLPGLSNRSEGRLLVQLNGSFRRDGRNPARPRQDASAPILRRRSNPHRAPTFPLRADCVTVALRLSGSRLRSSVFPGAGAAARARQSGCANCDRGRRIALMCPIFVRFCAIWLGGSQFAPPGCLLGARAGRWVHRDRRCLERDQRDATHAVPLRPCACGQNLF